MNTTPTEITPMPISGEATFVKMTADGRKVEVIDGYVCLNGVPEAGGLVEIGEHPNRQAIRSAVPGATHVAGRIPLRHDEAAIAIGALTAAQRKVDADPVAINERIRKAVFVRQRDQGVE
ncbi:hypothetical protein [Derxia gummosa]|uniref:Uncharacterized protein n=1 Tax=Derxia gummosa DSM 723 TaxID=1121388 RepID=A0A9U5GGZ8_9BURK|nr:hypothetical protein [Derxia gummosa]